MVVCSRGSVKGNESTSTPSYVGLGPKHSIKRFFPCRSRVNKRLVLRRDEQNPTNAIGAIVFRISDCGFKQTQIIALNQMVGDVELFGVVKLFF